MLATLRHALLRPALAAWGRESESEEDARRRNRHGGTADLASASAGHAMGQGQGAGSAVRAQFVLPLQALAYPLRPAELLLLTQAHARRLARRAPWAAAARAHAMATHHVAAVSGGRPARLRLCYASRGFERHPHGPSCSRPCSRPVASCS